MRRLVPTRELRTLAVVVLWVVIAGTVESALARGQTISSAKLSSAKPSSAKHSLIHGFPLTKFYETPDPLPAGKPGDLIRSAVFDAYDLPVGVSALRILYHSRSADRADEAASGVVLFPEKKAPAGGWPVIVWAHDETGVARECAPSLARNLQHGPFLAMYVKVGYAVVAVDYTGLGTKFRHAFADAQSNAWDLIDSVAAARSAVPYLGPRWIAMGTGQGGMAAVKVSELEHNIRDPNYLGSVAISRMVDLSDVFAPPNHFSDDLPILLGFGIKTVYPQFEVREILSDSALPLYQRVEQTCSGAENRVPAAPALKPGWQNNPFVQKYFERNRLGMQRADTSLLVVGSADDPSIAQTKKIVRRLCEQGSRVQFETYPESDPGRVIGDSVRDQMAWIQARFAGRQAPNDCSTVY